MAIQMGLLSRAQAAAQGMTNAHIRHALECGEWKRVNRGVYASSASAPTWEQEVLGWCLRREGCAWASHRTAARLLGIAGGDIEPIEITVARDLRSQDIVVHHARPSIPDQTVVGCIPTIAVERTLIDLAASLDEDLLDDSVDDALMKRLTDPRKIDWRLRRLGGRGHKGAGVLRAIVEERITERTPVGSRLERRFLRAVQRAGLPKPLLQHEVRLPQGRRAIADFAYPEQRLIIEVLGYRWHGGRVRWERDLLRSSELAALGWRVLHVTRQQLRDNENLTMQRVSRALGLARLPFPMDS